MSWLDNFPYPDSADRDGEGGGDGGFYGGHAGDSGGGAEQLCESDYQADP